MTFKFSALWTISPGVCISWRNAGKQRSYLPDYQQTEHASKMAAFSSPMCKGSAPSPSPQGGISSHLDTIHLRWRATVSPLHRPTWTTWSPASTYKIHSSSTKTAAVRDLVILGRSMELKLYSGQTPPTIVCPLVLLSRRSTSPPPAARPQPMTTQELPLLLQPASLLGTRTEWHSLQQPQQLPGKTAEYQNLILWKAMQWQSTWPVLLWKTVVLLVVGHTKTEGYECHFIQYYCS